MEDLQTILEDYGLSPEEARVYLAMLIKDRTSILKISQETEIKRSTTYLVVKSLVEKKLARIAIVGKKKSYFAENPKKLLEALDQKRRELENIIPLLKEQYLTHKEKPKVSFYEGRDGVERVYGEIANLETTGEILWFSSQQDLIEEFYGSLQKLKKLFNTDYAGSRMIVNPTKTDREYAKKINSDSHFNNKIEVRLLPKNLMLSHTDNCIYENKLAIFSIRRDYFAIVIESTDIANTYRALFELAWKSAIKL